MCSKEVGHCEEIQKGSRTNDLQRKNEINIVVCGKKCWVYTIEKDDGIHGEHKVITWSKHDSMEIQTPWSAMRMMRERYVQTGVVRRPIKPGTSIKSLNKIVVELLQK